MGRSPRLLFLALCGATLTGCVERRFIIDSEPAGAIVYHNGQFVGPTPVEIPFTYYGNYEFELMKEGYETRRYEHRARAPWFEWFPLDFFSENLWPRHIQDNHHLRFDLQPQLQPRNEDLLNQARSLRERGLAVPAPGPTPEP